MMLFFTIYERQFHTSAAPLGELVAGTGTVAEWQRCHAGADAPTMLAKDPTF